MSDVNPSAADTVYDRALLLFGTKRDTVLSLSDVKRYGADSYGDADHVSIYGMRPTDWHELGVRLLGRTAVECTVDALAQAIAADVGALAALAPATSETLVIDPFAGSGNSLYWIQRHLPGSRGLGFESHADVFQLTKRNLAATASPIEVVNLDFSAGLAGLTESVDQLVVVFVGPPWGAAFDRIEGLDLRRTVPPVADIIDLVNLRFSHSPLLFAIQAYEKVDPDSLTDVAERFEWSAEHVYGLNDPGQNPGVLLGTQGWAPP